jgi:beta-glucosidase
MFIGYRWYDARDIEPQFPFGHGLGYTSFSLGDVSVVGAIDDGITISVPVANVGDRDGSTVVQVYVAAGPGAPRRPLRQLRAFTKVAVAAGEMATAVMTLSPRDFSLWDPAAHDWIVPAVEFGVLVGLSSRDLSAPINVVRRHTP